MTDSIPPDLFELAEQQRREDRRGHEHNLAAEARAWMDANPDVMAILDREFVALGERGKRFGIALLWERLRWLKHFESDGEFKLNNNYRAYVARELIKRHPEYEPLVEIRIVRYQEMEAA